MDLEIHKCKVFPIHQALSPILHNPIRKVLCIQHRDEEAGNWPKVGAMTTIMVQAIYAKNQCMSLTGGKRVVTWKTGQQAAVAAERDQGRQRRPVKQGTLDCHSGSQRWGGVIVSMC